MVVNVLSELSMIIIWLSIVSDARWIRAFELFQD